MKKIISVLILLLALQLILIPFSKPIKSDYRWTTTLSLSHSILDFTRWSVDSNPKMTFIISNLCSGTLKGELKTSARWIKLSETAFEGNSNKIVVVLDTSNLPIALYKENIEIISNGGNYTLPVRFELIKKKVIVQFQLDNPWVLVDSKQTQLNASSFISSGFSFVPLRLICEAFGAKIKVERYPNKPLQILYIEYKDLIVKFIDGESYMVVNGIKRPIDRPFIIRNNTTFIPLNAIKDIFNPEIQYNSNLDQRLFTISY